MGSVTFTATGSFTDWTVPAGVTGVFVTARGPAGANHVGQRNQYGNLVGDSLQVGGRGGIVTGVLEVTPGEVLRVAPGRTSLDPAVRGQNGLAGWRGGNPGGGAASVLLRGATPLVIASGGGGAGASGGGGNGGGSVGGRAVAGNPGTAGLGGGADPLYITADGGVGANTIDGRAGGGGGGAVGGGSGAFSVASYTRPNPFGEDFFYPGVAGGGGGGSSLVPAGGAFALANDYALVGSITIAWGLAPLAPTVLTPAPSALVPTDESVAVTWQFNAALPGDRQTRAEVELWRGGTPVALNLIEGETATTSFPSSGVSGAAQVRVRAAGGGGQPGPWSALVDFTFVTRPPAPVITAPAADTVVEGSSIALTWTSVEQVAYQTRRAASSAQASLEYATSPQVVSASDRTTTLTLDTSGRSEYLGVRIRDANGVWSAWAAVRITIVWEPPEATLATAIPRPDLGAVAFTFTSVPDPDLEPAVTTRVLAYSPVDGVETLALVDDVWYLPRDGVEYLFAVEGSSALGATTSVVIADNEGLRWGEGRWGESAWVL